MRWLALDKADGADAADGAERRAKRSDAPLGVLCCRYASRALNFPFLAFWHASAFRSWSISKAGEVFMREPACRASQGASSSSPTFSRHARWAARGWARRG